MTSTFQVYQHGIVYDGAKARRFGDKNKPVSVKTITGVLDASPSRLTIPAGGSLVLWTYSAADPTFEFASFRVLTESHLIASILVAKPTSATDRTPILPAAGPDWRWRHIDATDLADINLTTQEWYMSDNDNIATDDSGNVVASGFSTTADALLAGSSPKLFDGSHTPTVGRAYKIQLKNPGTSSADVEYVRAT